MKNRKYIPNTNDVEKSKGTSGGWEREERYIGIYVC